MIKWVSLGVLVLSGLWPASGAEGVGEDTKPDELPVVIRRVKPEYPETLLRLGNTGKVNLVFVLTETGEVKDPRVVEATHPDLVGPAIEAMLKWRFQPAKKNGVPVAMKVGQEMFFGFTDGGGVESFLLPAKAPKTAPEAYRYDTPPQLKRAVGCVYPHDLLVAGTKGKASVLFVVDELGYPQAVTVQEATHPEFGHALKAAMEAWRFEPAQKDGKPSRALLSRTQAFSLTNRDLLITSETRRLRKMLEADTTEKFTAFSELETPPKAIYRMRPIYPLDLREQGGKGEATVEFIIDRQGIPQLARVIAASCPEFGWSALTAIREWRFTPGSKDGKPVEVRVRQPFAFSAEDAVAGERIGERTRG